MSGKTPKVVSGICDDLKMIQIHKNGEKHDSLIFKIVRTVPKVEDNTMLPESEAYIYSNSKKYSGITSSKFSLNSQPENITKTHPEFVCCVKSEPLEDIEARSSQSAVQQSAPKDWKADKKFDLRRSPRILAIKSKPKISHGIKKEEVQDRKKVLKSSSATSRKRPRNAACKFQKVIEHYPLASSMKVKSMFQLPSSRISFISPFGYSLFTTPDQNIPKFANVDPLQILSSLLQQEIISPCLLSPLSLVFHDASPSLRSFVKREVAAKRAEANQDFVCNIKSEYGYSKKRGDDLSFPYVKRRMLDAAKLDMHYDKCIALQKHFV